MDQVRSYALIFAHKIYGLWCEKTARKRGRLITRLDIAFIVFLAILAVFVAGQGHTEQNTTPQSIPTQQQVAQDPLRPIPGRGGVDATPNGGTAACNQVGGPSCLPPAPPLGACNTDPGSAACAAFLNNGTVPNNNANNNDWLTGANGALFTTDPQSTIANPKMVGLWSAMNTSVLAWMAFMFIITGYRVMGGAFNFKYAEALETLPRVVLAIVGSSLSLFFMAFVISLENGLCQFVITTVKGNVLQGRQFTEVVIPYNDWLPNIIKFLLTLIAAILTAVLTAIPGIGWIIGTVGGAVVAGVFLLQLKSFVLTLLSIMLAVQLVMRLAMINIHIALGPWAFGLGSHWAELFQKWLKNFLALVFVQLIQVLCIAVSFVLFGKFNNDINFVLNNPIGFVAPIAILWLTLRIPKVFGASSLSILSEAGQAIGGAAMTGVGAAAGAASGGQALVSSGVQGKKLDAASKAKK